MAKKIGEGYVHLELISEDITPAMKAMSRDPFLKHAAGISMVASSRRAFARQGFNGPNEWRKRSIPNTAGIFRDFNEKKQKPKPSRFKNSPVLEDTGSLKNSIAYQIKGDSVIVGSHLPYAVIHQYGGESIQRKTNKAFNKELYAWLKKTKKNKDKEFMKKIGFLFSAKFLKTKVKARPFLGIDTPTLESDLREAQMKLLKKYGFG